MGTAEIVTDAGPAYIKAMGNRQGPHALACELVATQLAGWFGLPTFEHAIMNLCADDEIPFIRGGSASPGPAFLTHAEGGHTWDGSNEGLQLIVNPDDIARLVVFDTWTLNCDRHPPDLTVRKPNYDNVFLSIKGADAGRFRLVAMDHTHCFTCGRDLIEPVAAIDRVKDKRLFGLFPAFVSTIATRRTVVEASSVLLRSLDQEWCRKVVETIPSEWEVDKSARDGLCDLICQRSAYVADHIMDWLAPACWPQGEFRFESEGEGS